MHLMQMHIIDPRLNADFGPKLIAVAQAWRRSIAQALADRGLSDATGLPLVVLHRSHAPMRQHVLAQRLGLECTSIVRTLDSLEREGLVMRQEDPADRRAKIVGLTPAGCAMAPLIEAVFHDLRRELLAEVSPDDVAAAERLLDQMGAVLAKRLDKRKT